MDGLHFDALTRSLARRPSRRRLLQLIGGFGLGGSLGWPAAQELVAAQEIAITWPDSPGVTGTNCKGVQCPVNGCEYCEFNPDGTCFCWCGRCKHTGIVGGGAILTEGGGEAHLSLLATRSPDPNRSGAFLVEGQVRWTDASWEGTGLTLESTAVTYYAPLAGVQNGREVVGWMRAAQRPGEYPFVLRAVAVDPPAAGKDVVGLWVGDAVHDVLTTPGTPSPNLQASGFRYVAQGTLLAGDLQMISLATPQSAPATPTP